MPAGPWRRLVARWVDVMLIGTVVSRLVLAAIAAWSPAVPVMPPGDDDAADIALLAMACVPLLMLAIDVTLTSTIGVTPGKALMGLRVLTIDGRRPRAWPYYRRQLRLGLYGMGLGIPVLSFVTMWLQYRRVAAGRPTLYDEGRFVVPARPMSRARRWIAATCAVVTVGGGIALMIRAWRPVVELLLDG